MTNNLKSHIKPNTDNAVNEGNTRAVSKCISEIGLAPQQQRKSFFYHKTLHPTANVVPIWA
jgi:hypothetical protein